MPRGGVHRLVPGAPPAGTPLLLLRASLVQLRTQNQGLLLELAGLALFLDPQWSAFAGLFAGQAKLT